MDTTGYIPRIADRELADRLSAFGAVLIEGPQWCGKTTTARRAAASELLVSDPANDFGNRALAELDPALAVEGASPRLIDEWQEVPKLWDAVRFECDRRGGAGHFVLTGSATPREASRPMHSGAGRFARMRMGTMTLFESGDSDGSASLSAMLEGDAPRGAGSLDLRGIAVLVARGGWPSAVGSGADAALALAREYVDTVAEIDVSEVDGVRRDPARVRSVISSLARNESTLASLKTVVADLGGTVTRQTAASYISALSRIHFVDDVPAWDPALRSPVKLRSAPKRHLADPSLAAAALGTGEGALLADVKTLGLLFESLVLRDLRAYAGAIGGRLFHYHDASDLEADAVVEIPDGRWAAFEVKLGTGGVAEGARSLAALRDKMSSAGNRPPDLMCVVVGTGLPAHTTREGVRVVPVDLLGP